MDKIPAFYLNLKRRPDRDAFCFSNLKNAGFTDIERVDAPDARTYTLSSEEQNLFTFADFRLKTIKCNLLGHMQMWKRVIERDLDYAVICQDDVYFIDDFATHFSETYKHMPKHTEVLWLGLHAFAAHAYFIPFDLKGQTRTTNIQRHFSKCVNEYVGEIRVNPCSLCYLITKQGAKNLLAHTLNNGVRQACDGHMNAYLMNKGMFYASTLILATGNPAFGSDVFPR